VTWRIIHRVTVKEFAIAGTYECYVIPYGKREMYIKIVKIGGVLLYLTHLIDVQREIIRYR